MRWIETFFAALIVAVCALLLLRMALGAHRRSGFDAFFLRIKRRAGRGLQALRLAVRRPAAEARARRETAAAIRRASERAESGEWDGNVYRPKSFKRKKRDLH